MLAVFTAQVGLSAAPPGLRYFNYKGETVP
jgi:hypothetical protein